MLLGANRSFPIPHGQAPCYLSSRHRVGGGLRKDPGRQGVGRGKSAAILIVRFASYFIDGRRPCSNDFLLSFSEPSGWYWEVAAAPCSPRRFRPWVSASWVLRWPSA